MTRRFVLVTVSLTVVAAFTAVTLALTPLIARLFSIGADTAGGSAAEFNAYLKSETEKWARVVKLSGAKAE